MNQCVHELEASHVSMLPRSSSVCFHSSPQIYKLTHSTNKHRIKFNLISLLVCPTRPAYRGRHEKRSSSRLPQHWLLLALYCSYMVWRAYHILVFYASHTFHFIHFTYSFSSLLLSHHQNNHLGILFLLLLLLLLLACFALLLLADWPASRVLPHSNHSVGFLCFLRTHHATILQAAPAADEDKRMREAQLLWPTKLYF